MMEAYCCSRRARKIRIIQNSKLVPIFRSNTVNYTDLTLVDNFPKSNTRISDVQGWLKKKFNF